MDDINKNKLYERICRDTWKDLYHFIYYKVQNREEAQDITQETYAKTFSYLSEHDPWIEDYGKYLRAVAMNVIRDQWRARKRAGYQIKLEDIEAEEIITSDFSQEAEERAVLMEALSKLTKEQQEVITLRIIKGYSVKDAAKVMKKKEGTVRVLQYRAVKVLSELLQGENLR